jgi:hypothetical protein
MAFLAIPKEERRILNFVGQRGGYERRPVFFRGQLLELMRLAVKYCRKEPYPNISVGAILSDLERVITTILRNNLQPAPAWLEGQGSQVCSGFKPVFDLVKSQVACRSNV